MKYKEEKGTPLRMTKPDHHLPLGSGIGEMEKLDPKVASGMSPEVGWNCLFAPWMDERGELAL